MSERVRFEVEFTNEAEKHYDALDDNMTRRVNVAIERLATNPFFGPNIVKLKGELEGQYRYRVGSYRIIYSVDERRRVVIVRGIFWRRRAYR